MTHFPSDELEILLRSLRDSSHSSFYRDWWGDAAEGYFRLTSASWQRVPLLPRDAIMAVPFWHRSYVPRNEVPFTRNTYGTSGRMILITPRTVSGSYDDPYREMGLLRIMSFFASGYHEFPRSAIPEMQMWFGDVSNLPVSARIAAHARIDSLYITPYTALLFAPLLAQLGAVERIRAVQLTGERCSPLQFERLQQLYPNASVYGHYASSETREGVAVTCRHDRARGGSLVMESMEGIFCELVVPETGDVLTDPHVHGELIVTTLIPTTPFPMVRYRTGDIAVYSPRTCACEETKPGFEIIGRSSVFPVRLAKGELTVDAVENALRAFPSIDTDYFEIHYTEEAASETVLPRVRLSLVAPPESDTAALAHDLERELKVFPTYTYAQGVSEGIYLPLSVDFIQKPEPGPTGKGKPPIVVRHVSRDATITAAA